MNKYQIGLWIRSLGETYDLLEDMLKRFVFDRATKEKIKSAMITAYQTKEYLTTMSGAATPQGER